MKVGYYGLRAKGLSFVTIILMCATVFVWTWKRTPSLSTFPAQGRFELTRDTRWGEDELEVAASRKNMEEDSYGGEIRIGERENEGKGEDETDNEETREDERKKEETTIEDGDNEGTRKKERRNETAIKDGKRHKETQRKRTRDGETVKKNIASMGPVERKKEETKIKARKKEGSTIEYGNNEGTREEERRNEGARKDGKGNKETRRKRTRDGEIGNEKTASMGPQEIPSEISKVKGCNYAKGKWVVERNQTLYSGFGCKQWLSEMWSCRSTRRTDFAYENLRWQPKDCRLERFEESKFLKRLENKTLAFVGDSLGRQQFQSLICMITSGNQRDDVIDVGEEYGISRAQGHARADGWAFRFPSTNTTVMYYWSASLCDIQPMNTTNPTTDYAMHLDHPAAFLTQNIHRIDVLVLNTAHHWNRGKLKANRWIMHVGGALNTNRHLQEIWKARNLTVHSIIKWANTQLPKYPNLKVFYRTISPRHFVGGDWNTGGSCDNTTPMSIGKEIVQDESSDLVAASAVKGTAVKLLDITALSSLRDEAHISRFRNPPNSTSSDCLHWCLPGVPDTWNEILFAQL